MPQICSDPIELPVAVRTSDHVLFRAIGHEGVLLNIDTGRYFGLDEVATRIWQLLMEHRDVGVVYDLLRQEFEVDDTELRTDLGELVSQLITHHLLYVDAQ